VLLSNSAFLITCICRYCIDDRKCGNGGISGIETSRQQLHNECQTNSRVVSDDDLCLSRCSAVQLQVQVFCVHSSAFRSVT